MVSASQVASGCTLQRHRCGRAGVEEGSPQQLLGFLPGVLGTTHALIIGHVPVGLCRVGSPTLMKLFYKLFSIPLGLLAGQVAKKVFEQVWGLIDDREPPKANIEEAT